MAAFKMLGLVEPGFSAVILCLMMMVSLLLRLYTIDIITMRSFILTDRNNSSQPNESADVLQFVPETPSSDKGNLKSIRR